MVRYVLLANLYAAIFFALYYFLLARKNNLLLQRAFLLTATVLSIGLPMVIFTGTAALLPVENMPEFALPEYVVAVEKKAQFNLLSLLQWHTWLALYVLIAFVLLTRLLYQIDKVQSVISKGKEMRYGQYRLITNSGVGPASMGNTIFIPEDAVSELVLKHEIAHIRLRHYWDKLFMEIIACLFFPIVAIRLIKKSLYLVHEYQADAASCDDISDFANALLAQQFNSDHFSILNTFFHHPIKNRIMMLSNKRKISPFQKLTLGLVCGTLIAGIIVFQPKANVTAAPRDVPNAQKDTDSVIYIGSYPEFPGGQAAMYQFLSENIKYPKKAKKDGIQGKVVVKFVVDKSGEIRDINIVRPVSEELDNEAIRVIKAMPNWKPGKDKDGNPLNVYFTLPVSFKL